MKTQYRAERYDFNDWFVEGYKKNIRGMVVLVDKHNREYHVKPETLVAIKEV